MAEVMTMREYATHRGVSRQAVYVAARAGRITAQGGVVDPDVADAEWASSTNPLRPGVRTSPAIPAKPHRGGARNPRPPDPLNAIPPTAPRPRPPAAPEAPATAPPPPNLAAPVGPSYIQSRSIREAWSARRERLEFERLEGTLVPVQDVRRAVHDAARRVRDLLMAIPDRLAPTVAAETNATKVRQLLDSEVRRSVDELNNIFST